MTSFVSLLLQELALNEVADRVPSLLDLFELPLAACLPDLPLGEVAGSFSRLRLGRLDISASDGGAEGRHEALQSPDPAGRSCTSCFD